MNWLKNKYVLEGLVFTGGALIGATVSYFVTRHLVSKEYESILDKEIEAAQQHYNDYVDAFKRKYKLEEYESPSTTAEELLEEHLFDREEMTKLVESVVKLRYIPSEDVESSGVVESFEIEGTYVNLEDVAPPRERQKFPFLITEEEYYDGEPRHSKETLIYYEGDDILVDSNERIIDNLGYTIGEYSTLVELDHSNQTIWVRNDNSSTDYEVVYNEGSFSELVLGIHTEIPEVIRKMRNGD